ncbi:MAG: hypothetical protein Q9226_006250 [Calogaya cf. arnoldii]
MDSWSRQPPLETIKFIADVALKMRNAVERGLLAFLQVTFQFTTAASVVFAITAVGLALRAVTTGPSSYPERPLVFEIEE